MHEWFQTPPGRYLLEWERAQVEQAVADVFGYHAVQLGMADLDALQTNRMPHRWLALDAPGCAATGGALAEGDLQAEAPEGAPGANRVVPRPMLMTDFAALPFPAASLDLVVLQIKTAAGHPLPLTQADVRLDGHVLECRINAEDPDAGFKPAPGRITAWRAPDAQDGAIRVDTHVEAGYVVPPHYDSLLCKIIARGRDR